MRRALSSINTVLCESDTQTRSTMLVLVLVLTLSALIGCGSAAAAPAVGGKRCGSKTCDPLSYCSPIHEQCVPCERVCTVSHNYDPQICASECEHFSLNGAIQRLQAQQNVTLTLLIVLAVLFVLLNGVQAVRWARRHGHLSFKCLRVLRPSHHSQSGNNNKSGPQTLSADQLTHANPHTQSPKAQRAQSATANLSLGVLDSGGGPTLRAASATTVAMKRAAASTVAPSEDGLDNLSTVQTVSTPLSRHPGEDSTENYSYDNAGMQVTPTTPNHKQPNASESTF